MKLPSLIALQQKEKNATSQFNITVNVQAANEKEAEEMQDAIQSFVSHFSVLEMKSAAHKLKSPTNRKMIKTFL